MTLKEKNIAAKCLIETPEFQLFYNLKGVSKVLGTSPRSVASFLIRERVPHYRISKGKVYYLPEVLDAVNKTRWKDAPINEKKIYDEFAKRYDERVKREREGGNT